MYQCIVRRKEGDTFQASAELLLGGKENFLLLSLFIQLCFLFNSIRCTSGTLIQLH